MKVVDLILDIEQQYKRQNVQTEYVVIISSRALFELKTLVELKDKVSGIKNTILGMPYKEVYAMNDILVTLVPKSLYIGLMKDIHQGIINEVGSRWKKSCSEPL